MNLNNWVFRDQVFQHHTKSMRSIVIVSYLEMGFIVCDNPLAAEAAYNRHKYLHQLLCWISPQSLYTNILNKQKASGPTPPLRVITATLADRVRSLVQARHPTSPTKLDPLVRK